MSFKFNKKTFYVDSSNKSSGVDSNFYINIKMPNTNKFTHVSVVNAEITKSWNMVNSTNNTLTMTQANASTATISITADRNYTAVQLAAEVQTKLIAAGTLTNAATYLVTYDANTNRFTISNAATDFTVTFSSASILNKYLGIVSGTASASNSLIAPYDSNLQRYDCVSIRSSICSNYDTDELCFIQTSGSGDGEVIRYEPNDPNFTACTINSNDNDYRFSIHNAVNNELINIDGVPVRLVLVCWSE